MGRRPPPPASIRLAALAAVVGFFAPSGRAVASPPPQGGCPQPPNSIVLTEFMTGPESAPRWVEVRNPGAYAVSLANVFLSAGDTAPSWHLGQAVPELPAGESVAFGHVTPNPPGGPSNAWLKLKVVELGETFQLPPCNGKLVVDGPWGGIDEVSYELCSGTGAIKPIVVALEPQFTDVCKNDMCNLTPSAKPGSSVWCVPPGELSGIGTPGKVNAPCDLDGDGFTSTAGDCNDQAMAIYPGAVDVCNGVDDDCNGATDDGVQAPPGTCLESGVCLGPLKDGSPVAKCAGKAGFTCTYPLGYESVTETLCDDFDNDCDGETDEGLRNACGGCGPAPVETCNGMDDDCDGKTDDDVKLAPGTCGTMGVCLLAKGMCGAGGKPVCALPPAWEAVETLCDGADNDCDGSTDEDFGLGAACTAGRGACTGPGLVACGSGGALTCSAKPGTALPEAHAERCGNSLDDDCDGATDEGFDIGQECSAGLGICRVTGKQVCAADGKAAVCNVKPAPAEPSERCGNGLDDDCDGKTDEPGCTSASDTGCGAGAGGSGNSGNSGGVGWLLALTAAALTARGRVRRRT
jgi:hypothetical protein